MSYRNNSNHKTSLVTLFVLPLTTLTALSALLLSSPHTSADSSAALDIAVTVPATCSLTSTPDTLSTTITPGNSGQIGTFATITSICHDPGGLAVYAVVYTGDSYGNNNLSSTIGGNTINIASHVTTSGTPSASEWNMTINAVSGTYAPTIVPEFDNTPHIIPTEYTKVAYRNFMTDLGAGATGANFTATFNAYISPAQAAGIYRGKVKFTLVHPSVADVPVDDDQVAVIYDSNGLTFDGGTTTNRVVYSESCGDRYGYISDTPTIIKTDNLNNDGTQIAGVPYDDEGYYEGGLGEGYYEYEGASKIKLTLDYRVSNSTYLYISGQSNYENIICYSEESNGCSDTRTIIFDGSYLDIYFAVYDNVDPDYDYGVYMRAYPIYENEHEGATYGITDNICTFVPVNGTYSETTTWNYGWYLVEDDGNYAENFYDETEVTSYLEENKDTLGGATITVFARNTYTIVFDANGGSGTMASQEFYPYAQRLLNESTFTMPHSDVVRWSTEPDGSGESYPASGGVKTQIYKPIANATGGESVTLYAQWGACAPYSICYDDNGANSETTMGRQNAYFQSSNYSNLWASNFQRSGYGFAGWNTKADGTGTKYGPNGNLNILGRELASEGLRMYAMWVPSADNIQNWSGCSALNIRDVTALTDTRDGNTYAVAKLADGNCWMIENLRLGGAADITLTTSDTETAGVLPASMDTFGTAENGQYVNAGNTISPVAKMTSERERVYSYGNYYSWAAAINSTIIYNTGVADTSICPSGWHLPYGGSDKNTNGSFIHLGVQMNASSSSVTSRSSEVWRSYPNNFVMDGGTYSGAGEINYSYAHYWSSLSYKQGYSNYVDRLTISYSELRTNQTGISQSPRYIGTYVRCLADASLSNSSNQSSSNTSSSGSSSSSSPSSFSSSPLAMQSYGGQGTDYAGQSGTSSTGNEESGAKGAETSSETGSTTPLGVKKSNDEASSTATNDTSDSVYGVAAIAGAAVLAGTGIFVAAKRKKDNEEES